MSDDAATTTTTTTTLIQMMQDFLDMKKDSLTWIEADQVRRLSTMISDWAYRWMNEWENSSEHRPFTFTKWDLMDEQHRMELDATPFRRPGTKDSGECSRCHTTLPTEGAFARHFVISSPHHYNLGRCPNERRDHE